MNIYAVDVTVSTHDGLHAGVVEMPYCAGGQTWRRVLLSSDEVDSDHDAVLLAVQMTTTTTGLMCTSARLVSWPES